MEVGSYDGEDFHPSIEPMVIINSEEDEEENVSFFCLSLLVKMYCLMSIFACLVTSLPNILSF